MSTEPFVPIPFVGDTRDTPFYVPPTIQTDFERYLDTDIPNVNFSFEVVSDWVVKHDPTTVNYQPVYIRAEMFPINWKSALANADNTMNFKTDLRVPVKKGDIVIREDGQIRQLAWKVERHINDQSSQIQECNIFITVYRHVPEVIDNTTGMLVTEAYDRQMITDHPGVIYQYEGRPYFDNNINAVGITPDALTVGQLQWNSGTSLLRVGDEFVWQYDRYKIINLDYSGIDITQTNGILRFHARKIAGMSDDVS